MSQNPDSIVREMRLKAPVEKVWEALASAEGVARWFPDRIEGDWGPGGEPKMFFGEMEVPVKIEAYEPPTKLAYRWVPGYPDGTPFRDDTTTVVTFTLTPDGDGTLLNMTETGFAKVAASKFEDNTGGWTEMLGKLEALFE